MPLPLEATGQVPCVIAQQSRTDCGCTRIGFRPAAESVLALVRKRAQEIDLCGRDGRPACESLCFCEVDQLTGPAAEECRSAAPMSRDGWCYVDPALGLGEDALVTACPDEAKRRLRFKSETEGSGPLTFIACESRWSFAALGPDRAGAVGDTCVPSIEAEPTFSGFGLQRVSVELGSPQCSSGLCLVNHFQGRVTCPYGQVLADSTEHLSCPTPGIPGGVVYKAVEPQAMNRRPPETVYCSCRCAGPGPGPFCTCPDSYACAPLVDDVGLPTNGAVAGAYCIKQGTEFNGFTNGECDRAIANCE